MFFHKKYSEKLSNMANVCLPVHCAGGYYLCYEVTKMGSRLYMNHKITNMGGGWLIHVDKIQIFGEMCNNYVQAVKVTSLTAQAALSNGTRQIMGFWPMLTMGFFL